jgi:hypothetical protein
MTSKTTETTERMAATARMVRDGLMTWTKGRRMPLRYWVALAKVEAANSLTLAKGPRP